MSYIIKADQAVFAQVWRPFVTIDGRLIKDFIARELYDFRSVMTEVRAAYRALAGIDRPDAPAYAVLAHASRTAAEVRAAYLGATALVIADDEPAAGEVRAALRRIAERWLADTPEPEPLVMSAAPAWMTAAWHTPRDRDHEVEFRQVWREHLIDDAGQLDQPKVAEVLAVYWQVLRSVAEVYTDLAGLSKQRTPAHHVIDAAEERWSAIYADALCGEAYPMPDGPVRDVLINLAISWHAPAWDEHLESHAILARLTAAAAA